MGRGIEDGEFLKGSIPAPSLSATAASAGKEPHCTSLAREHLLSALLDHCGTDAFAIDRLGKVVFLNSGLGSLPPGGCALNELLAESLAEMVGSAAEEIFKAGTAGILEIKLESEGESFALEQRFSPFRNSGTSTEPELVLASSRITSKGQKPEAGKKISLRGKSLKALSCAWIESPWRKSGSAQREQRRIRDYEEELAESEAERNALSDGFDGLIIERLNKGLELLWGNRELCNISGRSIEELKGRRCYEAVRGMQEPCDGCTAVKAIQTSSTQIGEFKSHDGRSYKSKSLPIKDRKGELSGVVHLAMDITELRSLDEKIHLARARAEELSRMKSDFLACISHEIRTPLNAIVGMAELLKDIAPRGNEEMQSCCTEIERASDMLLSIFNDIIDYALLEAGNLKTASQVFELREEFNSVSVAFSRKAAEKGLEYKLNLADDLPWSVCGDPRHLRRMLQNLIGNAIKFTEKGRISISACIAPDKRQMLDARTVRIEVEDTGIGISQEAIDSIFEPFTQEDSSSRRVYNGTGLGLAIVKKLVSAMNGSISVRSTKGAGSVFILELPFKDGAIAAAELADAERKAAMKTMDHEGHSFAGVKALLLDSSSSASLMLRIFDTLGVEAEQCANLQEAIDAIRAGEADALFFDAGSMKEQELRCFSKDFRKACPQSQSALCALTASASGRGSSDALERELCHSSGIDMLLSKPPRRSQVAAVLKRFCQHQ